MSPGIDRWRAWIVVGALIARLWEVLLPVPSLALTLGGGGRHSVRVAHHAELAGAVEVFVAGDYDIGEFPADVRRVLDLGANVGFATHFLRSRYPAAEIVAVEPAPDAYRRLVGNVQHLSGVTTLPVAVGRPGLVSMDLSLPSPERSPVATGDAAGIRRISLSSLLDMLGWDEVDVVKIDIEGAEFAVLADVVAVNRARVVLGEVHLEHAPDGFLGVPAMLPAFRVEVKSQGSLNVIFHAVRRDAVGQDAE